MANDSARVMSLFRAALEQSDPAQRAALLDQECGGQAELRARVEALLRAEETTHLSPGAGQAVTASYAPSASPLAPTVDYQVGAEHAGTHLAGKYKLIETLGEGGMGQVWLAQQLEPVKRTVAVKIIKAGMEGRVVLARFEAERQALAMMDHPNIAKVLDAGTTASGEPFFVMELVKGRPITTFCDERRLTVRQRLELFVPVCRAIQHAHQKGVIHRDIKPSNVLVGLYDDQPMPKVIDFGVAKAAGPALTEKTLMTGLGTLVGTPEYMSPEQASLNPLDVDTRSDVYALGVLLYELLTGVTPVDRKILGRVDLLEILRLVRDAEAMPPSVKLGAMAALSQVAANRGTEPAKLRKQLAGELDWVVLKALEKDRVRRYETASGLARDLERHLADEVVEARPPTTTYRFKKFANRHRAALTTAAAVVLLLVAGIAVCAWLAIAASRAELRANEARDAEEKQRRAAELQRDRALKAEQELRAAKEQAEAKEAAAAAVLDFLSTRILAAARPEGQEGGLGQGVTLRRAIEASLPFVSQAFASQPLSEARLRMTLGASFFYLGDARLAAEQYERARVLYFTTLGSENPSTLAAGNNLAICYADLGRHADALKLREETVRLYKAKLGPDHPDTLASMHNLANGYAELGRCTEALRLNEETLRRRRATLGPDHPDTLESMHNLAYCYKELGQHADALRLNEETLARRRTRLGADHPDTLSSMNNLATNYAELGRQLEALKLREETLARRKSKLGPDHPQTLSSMHNLALSYAELGRHDEARKLNDETLARRLAKLGPDHTDTLASMNNLAACYSALGQHAAALELYEKTWQRSRRQFGSDHPDTLMSMHNLASSYAALGRHAEALSILEEAMERMRAKLGPDHPALLDTMHNLASCYKALGRVADAVKVREELLARLKAKLGDVHPRVAGCTYAIACLQAQLIKGAENPGQQADLAMDWLRRAVAAGYRDARKMMADNELAVLHGRPDFKKLLADLEKK